MTPSDVDPDDANAIWFDATDGKGLKMALRSNRRRRAKTYVADVVVASLVLLSPLVNYLVDSRYNIISREVLLVAGATLLLAAIVFVFVPQRPGMPRVLVLTILVILFIDLQYDLISGWNTNAALVFMVVLTAIWALRRHIISILLVVFVTINATTLLRPVLPQFGTSVTGGSQTAATDNAGPIFLHIILDEHIGLQGMPEDMTASAAYREFVRSYFEDHGFTIFGGAYSRHYFSIDSIADVMNANAELSLDELYYGKAETGYTVARNSLFERMRQQGYQIGVVQSTFIDVCNEAAVRGAACITYHHQGIDDGALASLRIRERALLIVRIYEQLSFLTGEARRFYGYGQSLLDPEARLLPTWREWNGWTHPMATFRAFDELGAITRSPQGQQYFFAHILGTHYPYIYNRDCEVHRPIFSWRDPVDPPLTDATRLQRYPLYFDQLHCMLTLMGGVFDDMKATGAWDRATILVHGDHGSRIVVNEMAGDNLGPFTSQDLIDGYSTLAAIRRPGQSYSYDPQMRSVTDIVRDLVFDLGPLVPTESDHFVYRRGPKNALTTTKMAPIPSFPGQN